MTYGSSLMIHSHYNLMTLLLRKIASKNLYATLSWDNCCYIYSIYLPWYVSVVSVWILLDMLLVHNEYLFESAVFVNAAKRHQLPTIPWLDSVEYLVSQVLKKVHINVVWIPSEEDISMWKKIWPLPYIWKDCVLWLQLMDMMTILFYAVLYTMRCKSLCASTLDTFFH